MYSARRIDESAKREIFRSYVADTLKIVAENTARYAGGSSPTERYDDKVKPRNAETRTGEEIAADVIKKAGLKVVS